MIELKLLAMLLLANGSPVVARALLGHRLATPLDGGVLWTDGRPLLGRSKTWTGVTVAVTSTTLAALLLGLPPAVGALIGAGSMLGDALTSFVKRRRGLEPGARALGLDQIPEALVAMLACRAMLDIDWVLVVVLPLAFMLADLLISRTLYRLGVRHHPH
jgi:CDP-2,3-bis-(O-geranylgeranyl)-sn-glycerol synthase